MKKICLITCYNQPDYIRARTLRAAFGGIKAVDLIVIKNKHTGLLRYSEVLGKLIVIRLTKHPDIYFLTFRGYEFLPFVRLVTLGRPLVFDEFINPIEQVVYENHRLKPGGLIATIARLGYKFWLKTVNLIVTDTPSHASYSAELMKLSLDKYLPLIVSTDEQTFVGTARPPKPKGQPFQVFYYGLNMLPLHGIDTVIEAMHILKYQDIELILIGGKTKTKAVIEQAKRSGVRVIYKQWVPFDELPNYIQAADVCLGGPFGGTVQSQFIITGKTYQFLQMGRPVIIGRNLESGLFTDRKDVLMVDQASASALAAAILWAKQHPAELAKIGEAGQQLYRRQLSNRVLAEQLGRLLANKHIL